MNPCPISQRISAYHDGELPDEQARREVEAHLAECPPCAQELSQLRALSGLLSGGTASWQLSPMGRARTMQAFRRDRERSLFRFVESVSGIAAALLLGGSLWLMTNSSAGATPQPEPIEIVMRPLFDADTAPADPDTRLAELILNDLSAGENLQ